MIKKLNRIIAEIACLVGLIAFVVWIIVDDLFPWRIGVALILIAIALNKQD